MSLLPTSVLYSAPGVPIWENNNDAGIANNLTWAAYTGGGLTGAYSASIQVPGVTAFSVVSANIISGTGGDAATSWLICTPTASNTISFVVAANPTAPANFKIAWGVLQY